MNKTVLMIMGGAMVVAVLVAVVVQKKLTPPAEKGGAPAIVTTDVLVTKDSLSVGDELTAENTEWLALPDYAVFSGVITFKEGEEPSVFGKPLRRAVEAGEPVTEKMVVSDAAGGGFMSAKLGQNMRAMAISVSAETSAGGFVAPGDYVDVIVTYQVRVRGEAQEYASSMVQRLASQTVLSNVRVLAVDQETKDAEREAKVGRTVTLEVDKKGAETLALAGTMGELTLALRRLGDKDPVSEVHPLTTDVQVSDVLKRIQKMQDNGAGTSSTVRVYSGENVQNVPVRGAPAQQ